VAYKIQIEFLLKNKAEDDTIPVVIRKYSDCESLISKIVDNELPSISDFRALDQYKINLRLKVFEKYFKQGLISEEKTIYIWDGAYSNKIDLERDGFSAQDLVV